MTAGTGYLIGLVLALILYVAVWVMERDYYKRRHELIKRKIEKLEEFKKRNGTADAPAGNSTASRAESAAESKVSKISRIPR
jgi:hypothetical protein